LGEQVAAEDQQTTVITELPNANGVKVGGIWVKVAVKFPPGPSVLI
jgi:hypothetical protein